MSPVSERTYLPNLLSGVFPHGWFCHDEPEFRLCCPGLDGERRWAVDSITTSSESPTEYLPATGDGECQRALGPLNGMWPSPSESAPPLARDHTRDRRLLSRPSLSATAEPTSTSRTSCVTAERCSATDQRHRLAIRTVVWAPAVVADLLARRRELDR